MRSLINKSRACRDSGVDRRESECDRRAFEYIEELKKRCPDNRWNLVTINFSKDIDSGSAGTADDPRDPDEPDF